MVDDSMTSLEEAFHRRLLAAVMEVKQHTHAGIKKTLEQIQSVGGLQAAKDLLRSSFDVLLNRFWDRPGDYFRAAKRVGRMDLTVEAVVLEPTWAGLFNREELDTAASKLSEHGFNPPLERLVMSESTETGLVRVHSPFAQMSLREESNWERLLLLTGKRECDLVAEQAAALRERANPTASSTVRKHLKDCLQCRKYYPDLIAAYEHFDQEVLRAWMKLLEIFQISLNLGDADLERLMPLVPEDYEQPEDYDADLESQLENVIRPLCSWRAVRLGCHLGRFMTAFASTFPESGDMWLKWRNAEVRGPASDYIRSVDRHLFVLGLAARNLLMTRSWPRNEDDTLWLPTDGDLTSIPGLVQVDQLTDLEEWDEVLGQPPADVILLGILYLAQQAAVAEMREMEIRPDERASSQVAREHLVRMEETLLRAIQESQAVSQERQDAIISQLERMVLHMTSTDRFTCESALLAELPGVYEKLAPEAQSLLLGAEQIYRTAGFAAPGTMVSQLAAVFERQLQREFPASMRDGRGPALLS
jgi:hypothetical protein